MIKIDINTFHTEVIRNPAKIGDRKKIDEATNIPITAPGNASKIIIII